MDGAGEGQFLKRVLERSQQQVVPLGSAGARHRIRELSYMSQLMGCFSGAIVTKPETVTGHVTNKRPDLQ